MRINDLELFNVVNYKGGTCCSKSHLQIMHCEDITQDQCVLVNGHRWGICWAVWCHVSLCCQYGKIRTTNFLNCLWTQTVLKAEKTYRRGRDYIEDHREVHMKMILALCLGCCVVRSSYSLFSHQTFSLPSSAAQVRGPGEGPRGDHY